MPVSTKEPNRIVNRKTADTNLQKDKIMTMLKKLGDSDIVDLMNKAGAGSKFLTCHMCGKLKPAAEFYKSNDPRIKTSCTSICRECAASVAVATDEKGTIHGATKASISNALEYLDKPFIYELYDAAELSGPGGTRGDTLWKNYIHKLSLSTKYRDLRFSNSDDLNRKSSGYSTLIEDTEVALSEDEAAENQEQYEINRRDTIKFCGYDPFINEAQTDKPRLYAKLVGFLDDQAKEDPFKLSSIIEIVKGLAQSEKLNDEITHILNDKANFMANGPLLNKMMDTRKKCLDTVQTLARDNGISINFNKNSSAGQQTLSGRIKKVTEENLREGRVNAFDVGTCEGMRQIAEISEAARAKQLGMSEDILREIKDTSTALVNSLTKERDEYREKYRILLRENLDLKDYMKDLGVIDSHSVAISSGV